MEIFEDGGNFESEDEDQDHVTTLMEYIHTSLTNKVSGSGANSKGGLVEDGISPADLQLLNQKLIRIRTFQIMCQFRAARSNKDEEEDYNMNNNMMMET